MESRSGTRSADSAGSGRREPLIRPRTTTHFMVFLLTRGRYGGKSAHFWPSYARLVPFREFLVPSRSVYLALTTDYPSRSVPGSQIRPGNDLYNSAKSMARSSTYRQFFQFTGTLSTDRHFCQITGTTNVLARDLPALGPPI
jgi:hypothetical protein